MLFQIPDITDLQFQTLILRWIHSFVILGSCVELFRSIHLIRNKRVTSIVYRAAMLLLSFFVFRIMAAVADNTYYGIGWFSNLVNILFWAYVFFKTRQIRLTLQSEAVGAVGRNTVSKALDEILLEMDAAKEHLEKVK